MPGTATTHILQSQGEHGLAGLKGCQGQQQLTLYRANGGLDQQAWKGARNSSNSHPAEPRVSLVSRLERVPGTAATHKL